MEDTHWLDILIIVIYIAIVLCVGVWAMCANKKKNVATYFLAGKQMTWFPVGASLFASNIGSEHFIGLAGTAAASGIAIVVYEWLSLPLVLMLSWFFLPVYVSAGVYTLPEYLHRRFGEDAIRIYLSCLSLLLYIVTKIAVCIYAGALFINLLLGWNLYLSIAVLLVITGLYTVLGGLPAVIYTDALQTVVMVVGSAVLATISFIHIGGFDGLREGYIAAAYNYQNTSEYTHNVTTEQKCNNPRDTAFHLFRPADSQDNPWPGLLLQASVGCLWYWCCDQMIVQRALASRSILHAKGGAILCGYLKLTPLLLIIYPGMVSLALYPDEVGCSDSESCLRSCGNAAGCSNLAYPILVMRLLPLGTRCRKKLRISFCK